MKKTKPTRLFYLGCISLLWVACQEQNVVPMVDPCAEAAPFTARFSIKEHVGDSLVETDRSLLYNYVTFAAPEGYESYVWTIGEDDSVFTTPQVTLLFLEDAVGSIPVRLIAQGKSNACVAGDNGIDTVEQVLQVIPWGGAPLVGRYRGAFASDPTDTMQVVEFRYISVEENPATEPFGGFDLININKGCNFNSKPYPEDVWNVMNRGSRAFGVSAYKLSSNWYYNCSAPDAWLRLRGSDTLLVDFTYGESIETSIRLADQFIGIRIKE